MPLFYLIKPATNRKNSFRSIDKEETRSRRRKAYDLDSFWTLDEIYAWMQEKVIERPEDISTFSVGTSYEGEDIRGLRINIGGGSGKPSIFFEATIHANEWLCATSTIYIINQILTENYQYLNDFDWYFLPVLNVGKII
jgi:hypothetical protein